MHAYYFTLFLTTAGIDYSPVSTQLLFQRTVTRQCRNIAIVQDDVLEADETFSLQLSSLDQNVTLIPDSATITIENNDSECLL